MPGQSASRPGVVGGPWCRFCRALSSESLGGPLGEPVHTLLREATSVTMDTERLPGIPGAGM